MKLAEHIVPTSTMLMVMVVWMVEFWPWSSIWTSIGTEITVVNLPSSKQRRETSVIPMSRARGILFLQRPGLWFYCGQTVCCMRSELLMRSALLWACGFVDNTRNMGDPDGHTDLLKETELSWALITKNCIKEWWLIVSVWHIVGTWKCGISRQIFYSDNFSSEKLMGDGCKMMLVGIWWDMIWLYIYHVLSYLLPWYFKEKTWKG